jgi:MFS family permease
VSPRATFREVWGSSEFRALWAAQVLSVTGDQLARVALTLLVYDRTGSALLAAITFAASILPEFVGGMILARLADRFPRRELMIACDLARAALVAVMALPGVPVVVLVGMLFVVTLVGAPFTAARAALYPDILIGDAYVLGTAVTFTTMQAAQVAGFAAGGVAVGLVGAHVSLGADAVTFLLSAAFTAVWVRRRPALQKEAQRGADLLAGLRLVLGAAALRTPMLLGWLAAFTDVYEGVAAPLARASGGGAVAAGLILASGALGSSAGSIAFGRLVEPQARIRWMSPLAVMACAVLALFALRPGLTGTLVILTASGVLCCYQLAANAAFVAAAPPDRRSEAFGVAQGGITLGQGIAMILAGAATEWLPPARVIAVVGGLGALAALAITRMNQGPDESTAERVLPPAQHGT